MSQRPSYAFVRRPKWLAGHLLALVAIVGFINLGFWQLRRHDERQVVNATISERMVEAPAALSDLLATYGEDPDSLEYRRATVTGSYLVDEEVLWQARTLNGRSGHDVLTPLEVGERALIIDRGWVAIDAADPAVDGAEPPAGEVTVVGVIRPDRGAGLAPQRLGEMLEVGDDGAAQW